MMTFLLFAPASTKWLAWSKDWFVDIFKVDFVTFIVQSYLDTLSRYMIFFFCIGLPSLFVYKQSSSRFSWLFSHTAYYMHVFLLFVSDLFSCRWTCFFSFTSEKCKPDLETCVLKKDVLFVWLFRMFAEHHVQVYYSTKVSLHTGKDGPFTLNIHLWASIQVNKSAGTYFEILHV